MTSKMQLGMVKLLVFLDLKGKSNSDATREKRLMKVLILLEILLEVCHSSCPGTKGLMVVLRMFHQLGVRYMTLTHGCNNVFADSGGIFELPEPKWNGLS